MYVIYAVSVAPFSKPGRRRQYTARIFHSSHFAFPLLCGRSQRSLLSDIRFREVDRPLNRQLASIFIQQLLKGDNATQKVSIQTPIQKAPEGNERTVKASGRVDRSIDSYCSPTTRAAMAGRGRELTMPAWMKKQQMGQQQAPVAHAPPPAMHAPLAPPQMAHAPPARMPPMAHAHAPSPAPPMAAFQTAQFYHQQQQQPPVARALAPVPPQFADASVRIYIYLFI